MANMHRRIVLLVKAAVVAFVSVAILWCALLLSIVDYSITLPEGYRLTRIYGQAVLLSDTRNVLNSIVVAPDIDGYAFFNGLIVGHVSKNERESDSEPGFFVIDMKVRHVTTGLNRDEYLARLLRKGIITAPMLKVPARWRALPGLARSTSWEQAPVEREDQMISHPAHPERDARDYAEYNSLVVWLFGNR